MEKGGKTIKKSTRERGSRTPFSHSAKFHALVRNFLHCSSFIPILLLFCFCSTPVLLICRASFDSDSLCLVDSANLALKACKNYKKSQNAIRIIAGTLMCKLG